MVCGGFTTPSAGGADTRTATLVVAASDSLNPALADYQCDGVADEVEINAALAALPAQGGRVILLEGQYVLAASIAIPDDDIILEGQGWSAFLNGNNLPNNNNCVEISGFSNCAIKNLRMRTNAGGGLTCHCIFIEDGAHDFLIENNYFEDSDSDAIHIEGTSTNRGRIFNNFIEGADDHGIHVDADALNSTFDFHIWNNHIQSAGIDGIHFSACAGHYYHLIESNSIISCVGSGILFDSDGMECQITDNYIRSCTVSGIVLTASCDNNLIQDNYCNSNGAFGINIAAASCDENTVRHNKLIGNVGGEMNDAGTLTQLPYIEIPAPNPSTNIGDHPAELLTDGIEVTSRFEAYIPIEFQELVRAEIILVPGGTGNLRRRVATDWGQVGSGEAYNNDSGAIAAGQVAVTATHVELLDIAAAFAGVGPVGPGDKVGIAFTREGDDVLDTVGANCYLLGLRIQYV